jgi:hypothetical protein
VSDDKAYERAKRIARTILNEFATPQKEQFDEAVSLAMRACPGVDGEALAKDLETLYNVFTADGTILQDPTGHEPWLAHRAKDIDWDFWTRYEMYLEQEKQMPPLVLSRLDDLTSTVLGHLEDPHRLGPWDRRGMVVGQVQSGKTANYTGLICKAADAGYKLIVVMAGIHNSLRSQTQLRLDEGFRGQDTKQDRVFKLDSPRMGVGKIKLPSGRTPAAHSMTTSDEKGDFKKAAAETVGIYIGKDPVILVIKKNGSILKNLLRWVQSNIAETVGGTKQVPGHIPLLLIDDEADNASINTNMLELYGTGEFKPKQDVTRINSLIRQLLKAFTKSAYVGYTATPFANIFIPHLSITEDEGEDLFPRSFIINLPAPSNYIGPVQVFGLDARDPEQVSGLPIVRSICDADDWIPPRHKQSLATDLREKDLQGKALPGSLREAIRAFILTCAARCARGQVEQHNSMLVHVTRFVAVQSVMKELVQKEVWALKRRIEYGDGDLSPKLLDELCELWRRDFEPATTAVQLQKPEEPGLTRLVWADIEPHLVTAVTRMQVKEINGTAKDVLDYYDNPDGLSVIAIGGDKLSRGLTLEGLSVSYYLRASRMYDTLMQMGRWFGYRPGYADLCRLYTTPELISWYQHITVASEELREDFDVMAAQGATPQDYGLKVQTHPGGLMVTSAGKLRYGTTIKVAFSGQLVETYRLSKSAAAIQQNFLAAEQLVGALGSPDRSSEGGDCMWQKVPAQVVIDFLMGQKPLSDLPPTATSDPSRLASFITLKQTRNELTEWTVVLKSVGSAKNTRTIGGLKIGLPTRTPSDESTKDIYVVRNRHILTQSDEWIDLSSDELMVACVKRGELDAVKNGTRAETPAEPNGKAVRAVRPRDRGLLLVYPLDPAGEKEEDGKTFQVFPKGDVRREGHPIIGYAISFPGSNTPEDMQDAVEYVVNPVYVQEELSGYRSDEELNLDPA